MEIIYLRRCWKCGQKVVRVTRHQSSHTSHGVYQVQWRAFDLWRERASDPIESQSEAIVLAEEMFKFHKC